MCNKIKVAFYDAKPYDRISFTEQLARNGIQDTVEFHYIESRLCLETASFAHDCQAVCVFVNDVLDADVLAELDAMNIHLVLLRCAGFDRVDLQAADDLGVSVVRVPEYSPYAVAEFAMSMLLTLNRKTHKAYNRVREGNFALNGLVGFDVHRKTMGVVGTGKIGRSFINIALGFGCKVLAFDVQVNEAVERLDGVTYVPLPILLAESDIISLHAPLTKATHHLINHHTINTMKTGVYIINTSRGGLIDSKALVNGLISGKIGGAGLDVYEHEDEYFFRDVSDVEIEDETLARLQNMRNVLICSHQAFLTREALSSIADTTLQSLKEYFLERKSKRELTFYVEAPPTALHKALSRRVSNTSATPPVQTDHILSKMAEN